MDRSFKIDNNISTSHGHWSILLTRRFFFIYPSISSRSSPTILICCIYSPFSSSLHPSLYSLSSQNSQLLYILLHASIPLPPSTLSPTPTHLMYIFLNPSPPSFLPNTISLSFSPSILILCIMLPIHPHIPPILFLFLNPRFSPLYLPLTILLPKFS